MKRSIKSVAAVAVATLATAGLAVIAAPAAQAAVGTLSLNPTSGALILNPTLVPSAACSAGTTGTTGFLSGGPNNWAADTYVWKDPGTGLGANGGIFSFAAANSLVIGAGNYTATLYCTDAAGNALDTFTGQIAVTLAGATATASDTYAVVDNTPASAVATPTAVPATGIVANTTSVALSTTVTATALAAGVTTSGSVQFQADGVNIGAAVPVSGLTNAAAGVTVSQNVTFPTSGSKAITAVFTGTAGVVKNQTSGALTVSVSGPAVNTSLTLATSAASISTIDNVVLTATATSVGGGVPTGTVTFSNGGTSLGTGALNAAGVATLAVSGATLGVGGPYSITAALGASAGFNASTSPAVAVTVTAPSTLFNPVPAPQTIQTNVLAGTITVSGGVTATSGNVTIGQPAINDGGVQKYALQLNPSNTLLTNAGAAKTDGHNQLYRLLVTDSTAGNTGYKVQGVVASNFSSGANVIDSANLGWTPVVSPICAAGVLPSAPTFAAGTGPVGSGYETTQTAAGNVCTQVAATPGPAVVPGVAGTTNGLKTARVLYSTAPGASTGTVSATADLLLDAPTTTKAGYYTTTLTLTALLN
jgi:hypothetical protein